MSESKYDNSENIFLTNTITLLENNNIKYELDNNKIRIYVQHPTIIELYIYCNMINILISDTEISEISDYPVFNFSDFENANLCKKYTERGYKACSVRGHTIYMWKITDINNIINDLDELILGHGCMTKSAKK